MRQKNARLGRHSYWARRVVWQAPGNVITPYEFRVSACEKFDKNSNARYRLGSQMVTCLLKQCKVVFKDGALLRYCRAVKLSVNLILTIRALDY